MAEQLLLDGSSLSIEDLERAASGACEVDFMPEVWERVRTVREGLERQLRERPDIPIYGANRGCGDLKDVVIPPESFEAYQVRFMKSHNCGTGNPLPESVVRAAMIVRLNSFAKGYSAVREETCRLLLDMLNRSVTPWVLEEGSVGASGDLVPLAMIGAVMLGLPEAKAYYRGQLMSAPDALSAAELEATRLGAKEAMALTNGCNVVAAQAALAILAGERLLKNASISSALSLEAIRGCRTAFSEKLALARPFRGHRVVALSIRELLEGSKRATPEAQKKCLNGKSGERVQDRYSFRAVPQVHGAALEAIHSLRAAVSTEINSATDNPLIFKNDSGLYYAEGGANFHGQPLAVPIDSAKNALTAIALISDKRSFSLLDENQNYGLPKMLAADVDGGDSGLMIAQYAGAGRAGDCRVLSTPCSVMNITTSANQEDFVSMASIGALHLEKILQNARVIIAIELLCALRGIQLTWDSLGSEFQRLGNGTSLAYSHITGHEQLSTVPSEDRYLRTDMEAILDMVSSGELVDAVGGLACMDAPG
jgi:histidine ammonia-lyase